MHVLVLWVRSARHESCVSRGALFVVNLPCIGVALFKGHLTDPHPAAAALPFKTTSYEVRPLWETSRQRFAQDCRADLLKPGVGAIA